ncbi:LCB2b [Symbiodinium necroappetens]|uniref:Ribosomal protein L15 n=1 Tax=Symbiodinium necroappetens TaxID=1628268 RepID=A0A812PBJ2_9DINO|nr:LCB2b [Symbiodinium necroappetens]
MLLLNKICVANDEAGVDHDERAVCIRKAAELAAKEGPDQVCFRGQALLCIARAMAKEEAEQTLLALEESLQSILATARLPMAARMMSSKQQAVWSAKALAEGMGPRFADTCHRALLSDHRPEPLTSAALLRASAQLLHAGLRPKCNALTRCLAQRAATAAGLGADPDDDAFEEEEEEEREAARRLLRELFCCPRLPADTLSSLVEFSAGPGTMDGEKGLHTEPEVLDNLRHVKQLDAATKAYKRCASHITASGSKDMVQRLRVSTRLAMRAPGEASNHSELLVGLLGREADELSRGETLKQLRRVLPMLQGPGAEQVRKVFDAAWAFVKQGALDGDRESSICAVWLCADALKARRERLELAPTSPPVPEWRIPCTSEQQLPGADQNAWMQVLARLCSDTQEQEPPMKRRRLEEAEAPTLPATELRRLLVPGATRRWCLAVTTMALEYCILLGGSGDVQGSLALLSASVSWLRSSFQEWDLGRRAHRAMVRWLRGRLSDTLRMLPVEDVAASPWGVGLFLTCCAAIAFVGFLLALMEESPKAGYSNAPTSHLMECADSTDLLFSDLFSDGTGLGLLEPLWRLFTPEGALWTLLTGWDPRDHASSLGLTGMLEAVASLIATGLTLFNHAMAALLRLLCPSRRSKASKGEKEKASTAHEKIQMTFLQEAHAYFGYVRLFGLGLIREYIIRACAFFLKDELCVRYMQREKWSVGWTDFYLQHMYKLYVDCFARPIASAPDAAVDVVIRERAGGDLFGPLNDLKLTKNTRKCVNLSSYNYLGFGGVDEFCTPVARKAVREMGWSTSGTRTEGGTKDIHRQLEDEVAAYLQKEDALVLGMGFATNSTILPALFEANANGGGILVLSDELNHRSIVEGVRLSGATVRAFAHNEMTALEGELQKAVEKGQPGSGKPWRKIFVVVEGIYSMEGDFCRLREIVTIKNRYGAYLYLDEAHSIGAVGATGRGVTELLGVPTSEVDIMMGTFTKSFGSAGGYVAASKEVIAALRRGAPGSVFAGGMAPPCAAQALQALRVISGKEGGDTGARKLAAIKENANYFREELARRGFKVLGDVDSPIIPVMLHHPWKMAAFSRRCLDRGIAVVVVGNPAVPILYERVRFCISAAHSIPQLAEAITEITAVGRELGVLFELATSKQELEARAVQDQQYASWLRTAPLTKKVDATPAASWRPEALSPAAPAEDSLLASLQEACARPEEVVPGSQEFRLMDPLGYAASPLEAAFQATEATMDHYGFGACGPRGFYGGSLPHLELETVIAKHLGCESAIVYSAGVTTVSSVIPALVQTGDKVIVDSEVHLGFRAGLRLCKADVTWVPHNDLFSIERALAAKSTRSLEKGKDSKESRRTFIMVEAMNQRTGQLAPLAELVKLKERYGALLVLDETLSFGCLGETGRGLTELQSIPPTQVDAIMGSLEHAAAGVGGFCAGRRGLVDHQRLAGAGYCFSASCPPSACSAAMATVHDLASAEGKSRRERLKAAAAKLHLTLASIAEDSPLELLSSSESFVQQLRWKHDDAEQQLMRLSRALAQDGLRAQVCSPSLCGSEGAFDARLKAPNGARSASDMTRAYFASKRCKKRMSLLAVLDTQSARKAMELLVQDQPVELSAVGDLVAGSVQRKGQIPETISILVLGLSILSSKRNTSRASRLCIELSNHGRLQVPRRDVAQEAVGCDALLCAPAQLGVPSTAGGAPLHSPNTPGQGAKDGLQGELLYAKQGYCIYRVRVKRGDRKKRVAKGIVYGKPVNQGINKWKAVRNLRNIAEERVGRKCGSLRVLNSYWVAQDAVHKWFEVVMVDPFHKTVRDDPRINWICKPVMKHRELRGLTAAGKKARGLLKKGKRATKLRPSYRAAYRRHSLMRLRRYR